MRELEHDDPVERTGGVLVHRVPPRHRLTRESEPTLRLGPTGGVRPAAVGLVPGPQSLQRVRDAGRYVGFSAEDSFRSDIVDLLHVFDAVVDAGVQRIGLPDTVGIATTRHVEQLIHLCQ